MNRIFQKQLSLGAWQALAFVVLLVGIGSAAAQSGSAESYPSRPIRLIIPFPSGSSADLIGRTVAKKVGDQIGQPVIVENRAGAGGVIGQEYVARAVADGYTLGLATVSTLAVAPVAGGRVPYEPTTSFDPISLVAQGPFVIAVQPSLGVRTLADLIELARRQPGRLNYYSIGDGTLHHFAGEEFKRLASVDIVHVPYKGSSAALLGLLAGEVQIGFDLLSSFKLQNIESGRLTAIAVAGHSRLTQLASVPTTFEAGLGGFEVSAWFGVVAPRGVPANRIAWLNRQIREAVRSEEVIRVLSAQGVAPVSNSSSEFRTYIRDEVRKWSDSANDPHRAR